MQIIHYRNPHRVTWCRTTDIYWGCPFDLLKNEQEFLKVQPFCGIKQVDSSTNTEKLRSTWVVIFHLESRCQNSFGLLVSKFLARVSNSFKQTLKVLFYLLLLFKGVGWFLSIRNFTVLLNSISLDKTFYKKAS